MITETRLCRGSLYFVGASALCRAAFPQGVIEQSRDAAGRARRLQDLALWRASTLLPKLADGPFESPTLTIPLAQRLLDVTHHSAGQRREAGRGGDLASGGRVGVRPGLCGR
jgi:hypothetical protein